MSALDINGILKEAAEKGASDIYLAADAAPCMAKDGSYYGLSSGGNRRLSEEDTVELAKQITSNRQWKEFEERLELNMAYSNDNVGRFRVNIFWQRGTVALVCRRVTLDIPTLRDLGLPPKLREIALMDRGIVLITGATGQGKSSTQASMIDYRNHITSGHIVTIEDPVEFIYRHRRSIVTQREVGIDTLSFHEALRNTMRQAPQVICIGELRDDETVKFALHAAETGHLVFATLHSTNSRQAIERILNFYPTSSHEQILKQLSINLNAIICQRLVPSTKGGRALAIEILLNTPRMQDLIGKGQLGTIPQALAAENQDGIVNFDRSLYKLVKRGIITEEDAIQASESQNDLQMKFRGIGIQSGSSWEDTSDPWKSIEGPYEPPENQAALRRFDRAQQQYRNETQYRDPEPTSARKQQISPGMNPQVQEPQKVPAAHEPQRPSEPSPPAAHHREVPKSGNIVVTPPPPQVSRPAPEEAASENQVSVQKKVKPATSSRIQNETRERLPGDRRGLAPLSGGEAKPLTPPSHQKPQVPGNPAARQPTGFSQPRPGSAPAPFKGRSRSPESQPAPFNKAQDQSSSSGNPLDDLSDFDYEEDVRPPKASDLKKHIQPPPDADH